MDELKRIKNNFLILNVPTSFFTVATCKVYGVQREFGRETCKPKLPFLFVSGMLLLYMSQQ